MCLQVSLTSVSSCSLARRLFLPVLSKKDSSTVRYTTEMELTRSYRRAGVSAAKSRPC